MSRLLAYAAVILLGCLLYSFFTIGKRPNGLPPGPPTIPILGNIHQMPVKDSHLQFAKWAKEYGPVYSLILGTKVMVVLSSPQAIKDLLDKRSGVYSDRIDMYVGQELCSNDLRILMMFRKMFHSLLNVSAAKAYVPYQMLENKQMLYEMLVQPERMLENIRRYSNALTTTMVFGWRTPTYEDQKMQQLFDGFSEFAIINQTGTAALVDFFPILQRLPAFLLPVKRKAKELYRKEQALYLSHWLNAKRGIKDGTIKPCFCVGMAKSQQNEGFSDEQASYVSGTLLEAGSDTTSSTLYGFVLAMLLYPDVQKKAQEELDRVVGHDRLPTMEDEPNLQYIRGCVKETLRWMPTTILGAVPHSTTKDDWYDGYLIPKGAGIMNNVWGIHSDPQFYPDPRAFKPERYADDFRSLADAAADPAGSKRDQFTFGAGRRICPGMHVAERSLFLGMARMLWAFSIEPKLGADGRPILPDQENLTQGFVCMPEPFEAQITPRSQSRADLVTKEWRDAEREFLDPTTKQWKSIPEDVLQVLKL